MAQIDNDLYSAVCGDDASRARYEAKDHTFYFTALEFSEEELPWDSEYEKPDEVDAETASSEWLELVEPDALPNKVRQMESDLAKQSPPDDESEGNEMLGQQVW